MGSGYVLIRFVDFLNAHVSPVRVLVLRALPAYLPFTSNLYVLAVRSPHPISLAFIPLIPRWGSSFACW